MKNEDNNNTSQYSLIRKLVTFSIEETNHKFRKTREIFKSASRHLKKIENEINIQYAKILNKSANPSSFDTSLALPTLSANEETCTTNISNNQELNRKITEEIKVNSSIGNKKSKYKYEHLESRCKGIAIREAKIYEINKILAEKYQEELNRRRLVRNSKLQELSIEKENVNSSEKEDEGIFRFLCGNRKKPVEEKEDGCILM